MKVKAIKNRLIIEEESILVQGTVGEVLKIALSAEWDQLAVTAVFAAGQDARDVIVEGDGITLPWELLTRSGRQLFLNLHGSTGDGEIVMRTNTLPLGLVLPSRAPSGTEPDAPSPTRADEIQALAEEALAAAASVRADADRGAFIGPPGPNVISSATDTPLVGILCGSGGAVGVASLDSVPTAGSAKPVTSGGVKSYVDGAINAAIYSAIGGSY